MLLVLWPRKIHRWYPRSNGKIRHGSFIRAKRQRNHHQKISAELRETILKEYYWQHHKNLSQAVKTQLEQFGKALIIDCHSYPSKPLTRDLNQDSNRPDFNIGTDQYHTPQNLVDISVAFFHKKGYSLGIDSPYKGLIVPLEYHQQNNKVQTIMLEINRKLYLNEPSNDKSENYL